MEEEMADDGTDGMRTMKEHGCWGRRGMGGKCAMAIVTVMMMVVISFVTQKPHIHNPFNPLCF